MSNFLTKRREPFQFMLYLGIASSALLFLFVFLVFVKKELVNQDIPVQLPGSFWLSTLLILTSSVTLQLVSRALDNQQFALHRHLLMATYFLALGFLMTQIWGWMSLLRNNILPSNNTGGSFIFILSGLHLIHTLGGLVALSLVVYNSMKNRSYIDSFVDSVNPPNILRLKLVTLYWHFLDIVWIIIFLFFLWHSSANS
ncbi:heme-copper oxidase subunit III [Jiulongibacter sediminis]|uniref:cytochrome c oxidase subunit 3 n=1 Tax=Jiulongibacter sediminis TaxID=1605367 RepID=UPI0026F1EC5D|nr:heme-copper oxidase subunit III [Jiulongibacter sediminis]